MNKSQTMRPKGALIEGEVILVDPAKIKPFPGQPRVYFDPDYIERLANSINALGQLDPVTIAKAYDGTDGWFLVDGENRLRACERLGRKVRAIVDLTVKNERTHFIRSTSSNFNRSNHTPMEIGRAIKRFRDEFGMGWKEIGEHFGMSAPTLMGYYTLTNLDEEIQPLLDPSLSKRDGLPISVAQDLARLPKKKQREILPEIKGKRSRLAQMIVQQEEKKVVNRGGKPAVGRLRRNRPSERVISLQRALKSMLDGCDEISLLLNDADFRAALRRQSEPALVEIYSQLSQIPTRFSEVRGKVEKAFPEDFKQKLPQNWNKEKKKQTA